MKSRIIRILLKPGQELINRSTGSELAGVMNSTLRLIRVTALTSKVIKSTAVKTFAKGNREWRYRVQVCHVSTRGRCWERGYISEPHLASYSAHHMIFTFWVPVSLLLGSWSGLKCRISSCVFNSGFPPVAWVSRSQVVVVYRSISNRVYIIYNNCFYVIAEMCVLTNVGYLKES